MFIDTSVIDTRGIELLTCICNDSDLATYDMMGIINQTKIIHAEIYFV